MLVGHPGQVGLQHLQPGQERLLRPRFVGEDVGGVQGRRVRVRGNLQLVPEEAHQ